MRTFLFSPAANGINYFNVAPGGVACGAMIHWLATGVVPACNAIVGTDATGTDSQMFLNLNGLGLAGTFEGISQFYVPLEVPFPKKPAVLVLTVTDITIVRLSVWVKFP